MSGVRICMVYRGRIIHEGDDRIEIIQMMRQGDASFTFSFCCLLQLVVYRANSSGTCFLLSFIVCILEGYLDMQMNNQQGA